MTALIKKIVFPTPQQIPQIIDALTSQDVNKTLSANMGRVLNEAITQSMQVCPFPVGALIELAIGSNPNTFWQGTTWAAHGQGRATIAIDAAQEDFNVLGETGGAKNHVMTLDNMIEHNHLGAVIVTVKGNLGVGGGNDLLPVSGTTSKTGSATPEAMPTLPPYIVVARWRRTA